MAASLPAAHAEQDVFWTEPAMHPDSLVRLGDALSEIVIEHTLGNGGGILEEPLQQFRIGEERGFDLAGALESGERAPGVLVEPGLSAGPIPAGAPEML